MVRRTGDAQDKDAVTVPNAPAAVPESAAREGGQAASQAGRAALFARLLRLDPADRARVLRGLTRPQLRELNERWWLWAHPGQYRPEGHWRVWLIRAGRGFGKTRAGAEWVSEIARSTPDARIALVGATAEDVRKVMIEGAAGLVAVARSDEPIEWRATAGELRFHSGARAFVYSAETPDKLRGPEHHAAWCDEIAKWRNGDTVWDNLMLGLRLGANPQTIVTTTPRPVNLLRRVLALPGLVETRGRTRDNPHLPTSFVETMHDLYGGTRLGRQELDGEMIEDVQGALWSRDLLEMCRVATAACALVRVVIAVDPPAGSKGDACGIVAVALGADRIGYVLEDASVTGLPPEGWARAVAACALRHRAERVVAEANNGGDMVRSVLTAADALLPVRLVHASRGKVARAEPIATLYAAGKVRHVGAFPALEDELCGLIAGGAYEGPGRSPDRADALVWGLTEVMEHSRRRAAVRIV